MKVVKITVLERSLKRELVEKYGDPKLTACPILRERRSRHLLRRRAAPRLLQARGDGRGGRSLSGPGGLTWR